MEKIRRVWLNVFFLLVIQRYKSYGQNVTSATVVNSSIGISSSMDVSMVSSSTNSSSRSSSLPSNSTTTLKTSGTSSVIMESTAMTTAYTIAIPTSTTSETSGSLTNRTKTTVSTPVLSTSTAKGHGSQNASKSSLIAVTPAKISSITVTAAKSSSIAVTPASSSILIASSNSAVVPGTSGDSDDDDEPKTGLYVWQLVAIGCGAFFLILFIIIGLLCYQNRSLKKKLKTSRNYSLPIKENGAWIDNQDIPLWQKRASAFVSENPVAEDAPTLTT